MYSTRETAPRPETNSTYESQAGVYSLAFYADMLGDELRRAGLFTEVYDSVGQLFANLDTLRSTEVTYDQVTDGVDRCLAAEAERVIKGRLLNHRNMASGPRKIYLPGDRADSEVWKYVRDAATIDQAVANITSVKPAELAAGGLVEELDDDRRTEADESIDNPAPDTLMEADDHFQKRLINLARALNDEVPPFTMPTRGMAGRILNTLGIGRTDAELEADQAAAKNVLRQPEVKGRSDSLATELNGLIERFIADPGAVFGEEIVSRHADRLRKIAEERANLHVADLHEMTLETPNGSGRLERIADYIPPVAIENVATSITVVAGQEAVPSQLKIGERTELGQYQFGFRWLDETQNQLDVCRVTGRTTDVYIVNAAEPRLAATAETLHSNRRRNNDGQNDIQAVVRSAEALHAEGLTFDDAPRAFRPLTNKRHKMADSYADLRIWFNRTNSPNAPRVYFAESDVPAELRGGSDRDATLLIILAETDIAHQLEALGRFTTESRRAMRSRGGGSI